MKKTISALLLFFAVSSARSQFLFSAPTPLSGGLYAKSDTVSPGTKAWVDHYLDSLNLAMEIKRHQEYLASLRDTSKHNLFGKEDLSEWRLIRRREEAIDEEENILEGLYRQRDGEPASTDGIRKI